MWMDLPAGSCRRSLRSARFASIRIRFRRSTTGWAMDAWRSLPSRVRTSCTGRSMMQGITSALNTGNPLLNKFNTPGQPPQTQPPYHTIFVHGKRDGTAGEECFVHFVGFASRDSGQQPGECDDSEFGRSLARRASFRATTRLRVRRRSLGRISARESICSLGRRTRW